MRRSKLSEQHKKRIGLANKGKIRSEEVKQRASLSRLGKKISEEHKRKISLAVKGHKRALGYKWTPEQLAKVKDRNRGEKSHWWKGGISPLNNKIRHCLKYRQWRSDVFERDNYTCQECDKRGGGRLETHHIKSFAVILKENSIVSLDMALDCEDCGKLIYKFAHGNILSDVLFNTASATIHLEYGEATIEATCPNKDCKKKQSRTMNWGWKP